MHLGPPRIGNFKEPREKRKREKSPAEKRDGNEPDYLAKIDALPCCVCGKPPPSEHHHLKSAGKRGMGMRSEDKWCLPMCHDCHINGVERHGSRREISWFQHNGIDPLTLASALYSNKHSLDSMRSVLEAHRTCPSTPRDTDP